MKRKVGYFVSYYNIRGPWIKRFSTKNERDEWVVAFLLENQGNEDARIYLVFNGAIDFSDTDEEQA